MKGKYIRGIPIFTSTWLEDGVEWVEYDGPLTDAWRIRLDRMFVKTKDKNGNIHMICPGFESVTVSTSREFIDTGFAGARHQYPMPGSERLEFSARRI